MTACRAANFYKLVFIICCITAAGCGKRELKETRYPNGQLKEQYYVRIDRKGNQAGDGRYSSWYADGQVQAEETYKNGKLEGLFTTWYENGKMQVKGTYKNGKLEGLFTTWYENGQMQMEGTYKNGNLEGLFTLWDRNGLKQKEQFFRDNAIVTSKDYPPAK
jgi:antitoxin component YwqK of YwqJK toxin-antitoxin module